jgi:hypothetical protein
VTEVWLCVYLSNPWIGLGMLSSWLLLLGSRHSGISLNEYVLGALSVEKRIRGSDAQLGLRS